MLYRVKGIADTEIAGVPLMIITPLARHCFLFHPGSFMIVWGLSAER